MLEGRRGLVVPLLCGKVGLWHRGFAWPPGPWMEWGSCEPDGTEAREEPMVGGSETCLRDPLKGFAMGLL